MASSSPLLYGQLQEKTRPLIRRYHGREPLFDWMAQQISEAVYQNKEVTPYPVFLQQKMTEGKVSHPLSLAQWYSVSHSWS